MGFGFRRSSRGDKNGFVGAENCFVQALAKKQFYGFATTGGSNRARDRSPAPMKSSPVSYRNQPDSARRACRSNNFTQAWQSWFVSSITATLSLARQHPPRFFHP